MESRSIPQLGQANVAKVQTDVTPFAYTALAALAPAVLLAVIVLVATSMAAAG